MASATLRTVGGSVMVAIPKPILEGLGLSANQKVSLEIKDGSLVVTAPKRPRYQLSDLVAQCDLAAPSSTELQDWDGSEAVGREVI